MEFEGRQLGQFSGPGKGKTEHRPTESLDTGAARSREARVDLPSPSLPTRFALNPEAIPTPQPNIQVKDGMLVAELSVLDLVVKAEDPAAHPERIWEAPTVSLGIQSFTGAFHREWSQDLNPHDCACLSDFFRILSDRALAKLPGEVPSREVEEPKIHQREHDGRFVILDQKGTPFWWASFDNEAEARLAWDRKGVANLVQPIETAPLDRVILTDSGIVRHTDKGEAVTWCVRPGFYSCDMSGNIFECADNGICGSRTDPKWWMEIPVFPKN